eukprot:Gb_37761 [translate_table: standard]
MASSTAHHHQETNSGSECSVTSPKSISTTSSSEDLTAVANSSPKPVRRCLCAPTTHDGSFRCRLHRSSSTRWGKNPMPMSVKTAHQTKSVEAL